MMKKSEYVFLAVIILFALFLRLYNANELTGGDDAQLAACSVFAKEDLPKRIVYNKYPDDLISGSGMTYARPMTIGPILFFSWLFGNNKYAVLAPVMIFTLLSIFVLYILSKELFGATIAVLTSILFVVSPFHIIVTRTGLLHAALIFYWLATAYFIIKAIKTNQVRWVYLAALFCLLNQLTTDLRGLIPLIGLIPYTLLSKPSKRTIVHIISAGAITALIYIILLLVPLFFWGDASYIDWFGYVFFHGQAPNAIQHSFGEIIRTLFTQILLTPSVGLIAIPMLVGFVMALKKFTKPANAFLVVSLASIVVFIFTRQIYTDRLAIYTPLFVLFAVIGICGRNANDASILLWASGIYILFMLWLIPIIFPEYHLPISYAIYSLILLGLATVSTLFILNVRRNIVVADFLVTLFILFNILTAVGLVVFGVGQFSRPAEIKDISEYIQNNIHYEKYSALSNAYSKSITFYTNRPCMSWQEPSLDDIKQAVADDNLKYVVVDNVPPNTNFEEQYPNKYNWIKNNTQDISNQVGIADSKYFKVLEFV